MHPLRLKSHKSIGNIAVRLLLPVLIWRLVANRETLFNEMHYKRSDHCMQLRSLDRYIKKSKFKMDKKGTGLVFCNFNKNHYPNSDPKIKD